MNAIYVLTIVIQLAGAGTYAGPATSYTKEYNSKQRCEDAKEQDRQALSSGKIVLATCTLK